jgi:hypothetical protein
MELSLSCENIGHSAIKEIPHNICNLEVNDFVHKSPHFVPILRETSLHRPKVFPQDIFSYSYFQPIDFNLRGVWLSGKASDFYLGEGVTSIKILSVTAQALTGVSLEYPQHPNEYPL